MATDTEVSLDEHGNTSSLSRSEKVSWAGTMRHPRVDHNSSYTNLDYASIHQIVAKFHEPVALFTAPFCIGDGSPRPFASSLRKFSGAVCWVDHTV